MTTHTHATTDSLHSSHDQGDPLRTYFFIFGSLMVLLFMTVGAYYLPFEKITWDNGDHNLGWVNTAIALTIATVKASLVVLFFMHLRHSTRLTWVVASAGIIWLGIMVMFFFADYLSRTVIHEANVNATMNTQVVSTHANQQALLYDVPDQDVTPDW